jgi:hypothetical protein
VTPLIIAHHVGVEIRQVVPLCFTRDASDNYLGSHIPVYRRTTGQSLVKSGASCRSRTILSHHYRLTYRVERFVRSIYFVTLDTSLNDHIYRADDNRYSLEETIQFSAEINALSTTGCGRKT